MTTMALTVAAVRRLLKDEPVRIKLGAAHADTTDETTTLVAGDITKFNTGVRLEHDDGSGEQRRVLSITDTTTFEAERGYLGSTAATHLNSTYMLVAPRFPYDEVAQAVNTVIDADLLTEGLYDIVEEQILSSVSTDAYEVPSTDVLEILAVYQQPSGVDEPIFMQNFTTYPINADTSLYSNGAYITIRDGVGTPGTDDYFVTCKELLTITTLTTRQERVVQALACAHLLEWETARRLAGPTNQGDRTVRTAEFIQSGAYWREQARRWIKAELSDLRAKNPPKKTWLWR